MIDVYSVLSEDGLLDLDLIKEKNPDCTDFELKFATVGNKEQVYILCYRENLIPHEVYIWVNLFCVMIEEVW